MKSEKEVIKLMIGLYCKKKHGSKNLCNECNHLFSYASSRIDNCPFKETKDFCSNCTVHCYKKDEREKIRKVMAISGPLMIFYHPIIAIKHLISTKKKVNK